MDKIYIEDLEVFAYHGVNIQEKELGQKFLISIELFLDLREAGLIDNLNATVNYGQLCEEVEREFKKEKYDLIEKAAEGVAEFILLYYRKVKRVKVKVKKPWAPIGKSLAYAAVEVERERHTAYIGIGANLGDKRHNIEEALKYIEASKTTKVTKVSNFYETKPVGYLEQDNFLNCAIEVETLLKPSELIELLLKVEKDLKRERVIRWGPRTIDLDVLLYDKLITEEEKIIIPHPRMQERLFVLQPLSDIAPFVMHPLLNKRIKDLAEELAKSQNLM